MRHVEFGMLQMMASDNSMPDFTPGFFRSQPSRVGVVIGVWCGILQSERSSCHHFAV